MVPDAESEDEKASSPPPDPGWTATRRRLLRGGLGAAPVLLTLSARPVMAGQCAAASSFTSLDTSRPAQALVCSGRLPDYWKQPQAFPDWPLPYVPTALPTTGATTSTALNARPTTFDSVFGKEGGYPGKTLLQVLELSATTYGRDALARHIVAALLNAARGYTPPEVLGVVMVKDVWRAFVSRGWYEPTAGIRWYADDSEPPDRGCLSQWLKSTMSA